MATMKDDERMVTDASLLREAGVMPRRCRGCQRLTPTTCVAESMAPDLGGYWHPDCFRLARDAKNASR